MNVRNTHTGLIKHVKCCLVPRTMARDRKEWKRAVLEAKVHKGLWYLRRRGRRKNKHIK
jgi:hypothetical protein